MDNEFENTVQVENIESAYDEAIKINRLIDEQIITPQEIQNAKVNQIDQLVQRTEDLISRNGRDGYNSRAKSETILGIGEGKKIPRTELLARAMLFSIFMKMRFPKEFAGVVLFGSRTRPDSLPRKDSDQDLTILLREGMESYLDFPYEFPEVIHTAGEFFFGTQIDNHYLYSSQIELSRGIGEKVNPEISKDAIVVIPDKKTRSKFMEVFGDQMKKPENYKATSILSLDGGI